ncbi:MAG: DUF6106 family protein [Lachnospiraceae bacterium]|nr:DUF6106 family protein [Lachnospiraceae bacterium]
MNETYVECMIKRKPNLIMKFLKTFLIMITVIFIVLGMMGGFVFLLIGIVTAGIAYFVGLYTEIEYEYLYVDRQLSIDKVLNRSRRKKAANYEIERMEILAPINSYHLDGFKNRTAQVTDFSSGIVSQPDTRYVMFYDGTKKIIFEPNAEMVKAIHMIAPRKVHKD